MFVCLRNDVRSVTHHHNSWFAAFALATNLLARLGYCIINDDPSARQAIELFTDWSTALVAGRTAALSRHNKVGAGLTLLGDYDNLEASGASLYFAGCAP